MLTPRREQVLGLLAEDVEVRAIASVLGISVSTAPEHAEAGREPLWAPTIMHAIAVFVRTSPEVPPMPAAHAP